MSRIKKALEKVFAKERIVFWYDPAQEFRGELLTLDVPEVTTVEVKNDELAIKHRVMRAEPNAKFLIYVPAPKPQPTDNWLLDLLLANYEFETDPATTYVAELGLEAELKPVVKEHLEFFKTKGRVEALKEVLVIRAAPSPIC